MLSGWEGGEEDCFLLSLCILLKISKYSRGEKLNHLNFYCTRFKFFLQVQRTV